MRFTLKQLQIFLAVASHENVSRAATQLALSQSAASTALKELEQRFDLALFDRVGKRLKLSETGQLFRPRAAALLAQAEELEHALLRHDEVGELKVGATLTIGNYLAIPIMADFIQQHPGAHIELSVENTAQVARRVRNFELDIGLVEGELQEPELEISYWRDDELCVFCAPDHPLANRRRLRDGDLKAIDWIVRERGSGTRQAFDRAMAGILPELHIKLELQHTEGIKRAVEAGLGVGCLSALTLQEAFARGSLVPLPVPHRNWTRQLYFIVHRDKFRSQGIQDWMTLCRNSSAVDAS
ncbi:MAG: LysR family transcriptional regulator [Pseudohongiellaceae bacterium]|jgi:DNA-binding transcriptional LysR family regulator